MQRHILIAEDESRILLGSRISLQRHGFRVSVVEDGNTALERILSPEEDPGPVDLLVSDIQMPGLSGLELVEEIRRRKLRLPVVFMTGYCDLNTVQKIKASGVIHILWKPFTYDDLTRVVRAALVRSGKSAVTSDRVSANGNPTIETE